LKTQPVTSGASELIGELKESLSKGAKWPANQAVKMASWETFFSHAFEGSR